MIHFRRIYRQISDFTKSLMIKIDFFDDCQKKKIEKKYTTNISNNIYYCHITKHNKYNFFHCILDFSSHVITQG